MAELTTFLIAMSPVVELRGAIPVALGVYGLPIWSAVVFAVLGNLVPIFIIPFYGRGSEFLSSRFPLYKSFFNWLFERTRRRHGKSFDMLQDFALIILVAIPLPFTGVWTAGVAAFVFGVPFKKAFLLIATGVIIAAIIVTLLSLGVLSII